MLALDRQSWEAEMTATLARLQHRPLLVRPQTKPTWSRVVLAVASVPMVAVGTWMGAQLIGLVVR